MPDAASGQVSGPRRVADDGVATDIAETSVAGRPVCAGRAGSVGPNNESTDAGPTVPIAAITPGRVSVRSAQASVSNRSQLTPVA